MYRAHFVYPFIPCGNLGFLMDETWGCFHLLAVENNTAIAVDLRLKIKKF